MVLGGKSALNKALLTNDGVRLLNPFKLLYVAYLLYFDIFGLDFIVYIEWLLSLLFLLQTIGEVNAVDFFKNIKKQI